MKQSLLRSFVILTCLLLGTQIQQEVNAQPVDLGDYSYHLTVENTSTGHTYWTSILFANDLFGTTPTPGFDSWDAQALDPSLGQPKIYTVITVPTIPVFNEIQYNSQLPLSGAWSVPVGFSAGTNGSFEIVGGNFSLPANVTVSLEDLQLSTSQDMLSNDTYSFTGNTSDLEGRFILHFDLTTGGCATPDAPTTSAVTTDGFDVTWACSSCSGGETFILEYGLSGFTPGTGATAGTGGTVINPASSTETLSGLLASTTYDIYVRTDCGGSNYSANTSVLSETTSAPACTIPGPASDTSAAPFSAMSIEVFFSPDQTLGTNYTIEYGATGFTPGTGSTLSGAVSGSPMSVVVGGLSGSSIYDFYITIDCLGSPGPQVGPVTSSPYSNPSMCGMNMDIPDNGCPSMGLTYTLPVTGENTTLGTDVQLEQIDLIVEHTWDGDLEVSLTSPNGVTVDLILDEGGSGDNFGDPLDGSCTDVTSLNMNAGTAITSGSAPYIGSFIPEGDFADFDDGSDPNGNWILSICDDANQDVGQLEYVAITFSDPSACAEASFSVSSPALCMGDSVFFTDLSTDAVSWSWDFGDGNTSTVQNPGHTYQDTGSYAVTLEVMDGAGCTDDTVITAAVIMRPPVASFNLNPPVGCAIPHTVFFTDQSTLPDTWLWNFGDGNTTTLQNPVHSYTSFGTFNVQLTVTDTIFGCTDTATATVIVDDIDAPSITCPGPETTAACDFTVPDYSVLVTVADLCDPSPVVTQIPTAGTILDADSTIWVFATDASGNTDSCSIELTFTDLISPVCQNITVFLDATGNTTISGFDVDAGSSACNGLLSLDASPSAFTCSDVGSPVAVTLTVTDSVGGTATCTSLVTVLDTVSPVAICAPATQMFNENSGILNQAIPDNNTSSLITTINVTNSQTIYDLDVDLDITHAWAGDVDVTLESPLGTTVSILDRPGFPATGFGCSGDDILVTLDDEAALPVEDECGGGVPSIDGTFYPNNPLSAFDGQNTAGTWTLTINDNASGDVGELVEWGLNFTYTVPGNPQFYLDANGNLTLAGADIDGGSSDACGLNAMTLSQTSFNCADVGTQSIILTVEDAHGNTSSCTTDIDISDTVPPLAICQDLTIYLNGAGDASLLTTDLEGGSSDTCGLGAPTVSQSLFDCSHLGANTVVFTAQDVNGNSDTCSTVVTVLDTIPPVITCPVVIPQCGDDPTGGVVTYAAPTATDNCSATVTQIDTTGLSSGSFFPTGTTTLTYVAEDTDGNADTCSFDVVILPLPEANFGFTPACLGEAMFFTDESIIDSTGTIVSWAWDMGDGSATIGTVDPIHSYAAVGDYTVILTVETADGCSSTYSETVSVTHVPTADFTATTECNGSGTVFTNNWNIDAGYAGGVTFSWDFGDGNSSNNENPTHAYATNGTYTVTLTVTTDDGCEDMISMPVTVNGLPTALAIASTECEGTATQFTDLSVGSGLTWNWDFGDGNGSTDQHPGHTYMTAGTYTFNLTVTGSNGCIASTTGDVTVNAPPSVAFGFTNVCEETVVDFTNTSSTGSYAWDLGDGNSSILTHVAHAYSNAGTYDVQLTVTSNQGCVDSLTQQIEIFDNPEFTLSVTDVACYNIPTGEIQVNMSLGQPPIVYWLDGSSDTTGFFSGLATGMYTILVVDDNGCSTVDNVMVNQPADTLGVNLISTTDINCNGASTGEINLMGTGGTPTYTYLLGGVPQTTGMFAGLAAGAHNIQILDMNNCPFDTTIILTEPDTLVLLTDTIGHLLCNGDSSGFLGLSGTGGVMPYSYSLNGVDFQPMGMFNGLPAGGYTITVMDSLGCTDTVNVTVTEPGILQLSLLSSTDALCNGQATGTIEVGASSGTPGYTYSIDGGVNWQGNPDFPGVAAGTHTVLVMDANGCLDEVSVTISEPPLLTMAATSSPVQCHGDSTGTISVTANGGSPGYMFSNDGGSTYQSSGDFLNLSASDYVITVLDSNGCTASGSVVITEPSMALTGTPIITDVLCIGDSTGTVMIQTDGGTGAYTYSIDNGGAFQNSNVFENLNAGGYSVLVQDGNGCETNVGFIIGEPASAVQISNVLTNSPFCTGDANGSMTIQAFGGTPSYTYSIDGGITFGSNAIVSGLAAGTYNVVVLDTNGCSVSQPVQLMNPDSIILSIDSVIGVDCQNDMTGQIIASATGGVGTLMYSLDGGAPQTDGTFTNLQGGEYILTVTDANNCANENAVSVVVVWGTAMADFDYIVAGETVSFNNLSQNSNTYSWDFGDGNTSTEEDPIHIYDSPGNYNVTLTVTNECGSDSITQVVSTVTFGVEESELLSEVNIYPNPTSGLVTFSAELKEPVDKLQFGLLDLRGRVVWSESRNNATGSINIQMDLTDMAEGVYQLQVIGNSWRTVHRVSISR